jgi:hypothetical protein
MQAGTLLEKQFSRFPYTRSEGSNAVYRIRTHSIMPESLGSGMSMSGRTE